VENGKRGIKNTKSYGKVNFLVYNRRKDGENEEWGKKYCKWKDGSRDYVSLKFIMNVRSDSRNSEPG